MNTRRSFEDRLIERSKHDPIFRDSLLENPHETIEKEAKAQLPENVTVTVLEESPKHFYLVLPAKSSHELDDSDLDYISGGGFSDWWNK